MRREGGFSLIEVLVVISVIAILAAIVVGVQQGVRERAAISRAEGELAAVDAALEKYRTVFGDYPRTDGTGAETLLYGALLGQLAPDGDLLSDTYRRAPFIDLGSLSVGDPDTSVGEEPWVSPEAELEAGTGRVLVADRSWRSRALLDPWGNPYHYFYPKNGWERAGFLLMSTGPSGGEARERGETETPPVPADGLLDESYFDQADTYDDLFASF